MTLNIHDVTGIVETCKDYTGNSETGPYTVKTVTIFTRTGDPVEVCCFMDMEVKSVPV